MADNFDPLSSKHLDQILEAGRPIPYVTAARMARQIQEGAGPAKDKTPKPPKPKPKAEPEAKAAPGSTPKAAVANVYGDNVQTAPPKPTPPVTADRVKAKAKPAPKPAPKAKPEAEPEAEPAPAVSVVNFDDVAKASKKSKDKG